MPVTTILTVTRADNQIVAFLNGLEVYNKSTENNPQFNETVDLTDRLASGSNHLLINGVNWGGPATFEGSLSIGGTVTPWAKTLDSSANGSIWSKTYVIQGDSAGAPVVETVDEDTHPTIPSGLDARFFNGPGGLSTSLPTTEVIKWNNLTYWVYTYHDNRDGMAIVAYDASGNLVKQWDKTGARYAWEITVDSNAQTVTFNGRYSQTVAITMTWAELTIG